MQTLLLPILPEQSEQTGQLKNTLQTAQEEQVPQQFMEQGDVYTLGQSTLTVLQESIEDDNLNDLSPVLKFEAPAFLACLQVTAKALWKMPRWKQDWTFQLIFFKRDTTALIPQTAAPF